jgi:outer membrane lipoprotein-sorting protein
VLLAASAATSKDDLPDLLARIEQAANKFRSLSANVQWITHTAVIDDDSEEHGWMRLKKIQPDEVMALVNFVGADARTVAFEHPQVKIYTPKLRTVTVYDLGKYGSQVDQFLLVGFGTSGTELARQYDMRTLGVEEVRGVKATRLELIPKANDVRDVMAKLELWIPEAPADAYPIQQKFYGKSGDYRIATYSDLKLNLPLSSDDLKLKLPPGVKVEHPQK